MSLFAEGTSFIPRHDCMEVKKKKNQLLTYICNGFIVYLKCVLTSMVKILVGPNFSRTDYGVVFLYYYDDD